MTFRHWCRLMWQEHCDEVAAWTGNNPQYLSKQYFKIDNEEKRIVLGPAMIPDLKIFRKDSKGNPYYVYFSSETIKMIAEKYMKNKYTDNNDQMHDGKAVKDVYVIESWIKEDQSDKSSKYGYESTPIGTWFVSMKVKNEEIWKQILPGIEKAIGEKWAYGSAVEEVIPDESESIDRPSNLKSIVENA